MESKFARYLRVKHNRTLKSLSLATGIPYNTMKAYATKIKPSPNKVALMAYVLDVETPELLKIFYEEELNNVDNRKNS